MPRLLALLALLPLLGCARAPEFPRLQPADAVALGTSAPYAFVDADPRGRWVVLLQAREDTNHDGQLRVWTGPCNGHGDTLRPYFISGGGPGERFDEYLGKSSDSRFTAFIRDDMLFVVDAEQGTTSPVGKAARRRFRDDYGMLPYFVSFAPRAPRLAYMRARDEGHVEIAVRELPEGDERVIDPGEGMVASMTLEDEGEQVRVVMFDKHRYPRHARLWPVSGGAPVVVDQEAEAAVHERGIDPRSRRFSKDDELIHVVGQTYVVRHPNGDLVVGDFTSGEEVTVWHGARRHGRVLVSGAMLAYLADDDAAPVARPVIDLRRRRVLGHFDGRPLAIAGDGRLLFAREPEFHHGFLGNGPLWWERPSPVDAITPRASPR